VSTSRFIGVDEIMCAFCDVRAGTSSRGLDTVDRESADTLGEVSTRGSHCGDLWRLMKEFREVLADLFVKLRILCEGIRTVLQLRQEIVVETNSFGAMLVGCAQT
jgi:hypothetical protein